MNVVDCFASNLSRDSLTTEFWKTKAIGADFRNAGIATGLIMLLFFLIGLPTNAIITASILWQRLYKQPTLLILLNLALPDLLVCVFVMPLAIITGLAGEYVFGGSDATRCQVCQTGVILVAVVLVNVHILALLSLDRFLLIRFPMRYRKLVTTQTVGVSIITIWILSISISVLPLFGFGEIYYDHPTFTCTPQFEGESPLISNIYYLVLILLEASLPLSVLVVTNIWIICIARKQIKEVYSIRRNIASLSEQQKYSKTLRTKLHHKKNRKQLQLLRVFGSILISNFITWIPLIIRIIEASIRGADNPSLWSNSILILSIHFQSVIHPLIQARLIPEIRDHLSLRKYCRKRKAIERESNSFTRCYNRGCGLSACSTCMEYLSFSILERAELRRTETAETQISSL